MTDISKEAVEVLARIIGGRSPSNTHYDQQRAAKTLLALSARVEELEAALDSEHASVGSNIWRFWRDQALDIARSKDDAEKAARLQGLNEASIELRNRYEYQAARYVEALKGETTND